MKRNITDSKLLILILLSISMLICRNANSQIDTTKLGYDKKIDFKTKFPVGFYFNRIEGYTPFLKGEIIFKHIHDLNIKGNLNYSTNRNNFTYSIRLNYPILNHKIKIGGHCFNDIMSNESWTVSRLENTIAGIFSNKDYMNYYSINGYSLPLQYILNNHISFGIEYLHFKYDDLGDSTSFAKSLFKSNNAYRVNPSIFEAKQNAIAFKFVCDRLVDGSFFGESGWYSEVIYKAEFGDIQNNFFSLLSAGYIPTWGLQKIYVSGNLIMNNGDFYRQYLYALGGIKVMKAFDPYTDFGQNLAYVSFEYHFPRYSLSTKSKSWIKPIVFSEFGKIWDSTETDVMTSNVQHYDLLTDVGIGVILNKLIRFNLAKQIKKEGNWQFTMNLLLPAND